MLITTSRKSSEETIKLANYLSKIIPYSIFIRRGIKTFDKLLFYARKNGMNRLLILSDDSNITLRFIVVLRYDWNDLINLKLKSYSDMGEITFVPKYFKADKKTMELLGLTDIYNDDDLKIKFNDKKMSFNAKDFKFELNFY